MTRRKPPADAPLEPLPGDPSGLYLIEPDGTARSATPRDRTTRRRPSGTRWGVLAIVAALAGLLTVAVVRNRGAGSAGDEIVPPTSPIGPSSAPSSTPGPSSTLESSPASREPSTGAPTPSDRSTTVPAASSGSLPPWPTAAGACGWPVSLPLVTDPASLSGSTGIHLVAGGTPHAVDVDTGAVEALPIPLAPGEFVIDLASDTGGIVAQATTCQSTRPPQIIRVGPAGTVTDWSPAQTALFPGQLITGGDLVWFSLYPSSSDGEIELLPTSSSQSPVTLPKGFVPRAGYRDLIIGNAWDAGQETDGPIQVYSLTSRRVVDSFGPARLSYSVGNGYLAWTEQDCVGRCAVRLVRLSDGHTTTTTAIFGPGRGLGYGPISPDGTLLAVVTYDNPPDPRYASEHPGGPGGVTVLDLSSGRWTDVPGLELPAKSSIRLEFAGPQHWLVMSLDLGDASTILLWRPGLAHPVDAGVMVAGVSGYAPLTVP